MTKKEKKLASEMLLIASNEFSNHGCNDVDDAFYKDWTTDEIDQFMKEFCEWNGDPSDFGTISIYSLGDSMIMDFLAYKLRKE